jgi:hypothetical protein
LCCVATGCAVLQQVVRHVGAMLCPGCLRRSRCAVLQQVVPCCNRLCCVATGCAVLQQVARHVGAMLCPGCLRRSRCARRPIAAPARRRARRGTPARATGCNPAAPHPRAFSRCCDRAESRRRCGHSQSVPAQMWPQSVSPGADVVRRCACGAINSAQPTGGAAPGRKRETRGGERCGSDAAPAS